MSNLRSEIESFVGSSQQPVLSEPGAQLIELHGDNLTLEEKNGVVLLQAWDDRCNLARRVVGIESRTHSKLVLRTEHFGKKLGTLSLIDLQRSDSPSTFRRSARLEFREVFRRFLRRDFPGYKIAVLSTEPDLEQTLSSTCPRALLRQGSSGLAAIAAPPDGTPVDSVLSFGLIWLDYLRRREQHATISGLLLFLPTGYERTTCLRIRYLDNLTSSFSVFVYSDDGFAAPVDLADYGNLNTHIDPCRRPDPAAPDPACARLSAIPGVETIAAHDGAISFRVSGLEFARYFNRELLWGLETKHVKRTSNIREIEALASELIRVRSPEADHRHPLYMRNPESWLESQVRRHIEEIDATLCPHPVYGQVPAFAGLERGVLDLLAVDRSGRLAVVELKAAADIHLPLQALDYWIRVKWHLDRNEFSGNGYFPGVQLRGTPPRLLLVAPALEFHPSNDAILRFFSPQVQVERLGVGLEWQRQLKLMYRM